VNVSYKQVDRAGVGLAQLKGLAASRVRQDGVAGSSEDFREQISDIVRIFHEKDSISGAGHTFPYLQTEVTEGPIPRVLGQL
jgi:hypothetical protein